MPKPKGDADRPTTKLAPIELEALLHEAGSTPLDGGSATVEMVPLAEPIPEPLAEPLVESEPPRLARGTGQSTRSMRPLARGSGVVPPARGRRTVERLSVAEIRRKRDK